MSSRSRSRAGKRGACLVVLSLPWLFLRVPSSTVCLGNPNRCWLLPECLPSPRSNSAGDRCSFLRPDPFLPWQATRSFRSFLSSSSSSRGPCPCPPTPHPASPAGREARPTSRAGKAAASPFPSLPPPATFLMGRNIQRRLCVTASWARRWRERRQH